ncbi:MAG TPA: DNA topoisomerase IB [Candidatus Limnocylindria bacterium]
MSIPAPEVVEAAKEAGLRYATDERRGIRRHRSGRGFRYVGPDGEPIADETDLRRIRKLAIPPAWTEVWISPDPRGHLQATGRDAKGRKQYRYHERFREIRDETKYERMLDFAKALPKIRARVDADLGSPKLTREKVLATVVRLLETTLIRVGNEEYAKENQSYGLTTLRERHVDVDGSRVRFRFRGKSGKEHDVDVRDRRVARVIKQLQELPGQDLFRYLDDDGDVRGVDSDDVNAYLREIAGEDFTAKDFRTWAGTVLAAQALAAFEHVENERIAKKHVTEAVERVAARLGNTRTVCRKCYIHPAIVDAYLDGDLARTLHERAARALDGPDLSDDEERVLRFLEGRLAKAA